MYKCYCFIPCYLIWIWKTCLPNQFFFNIFLSFFFSFNRIFSVFFFYQSRKAKPLLCSTLSIHIYWYNLLCKKKEKERSRLKTKTKTTKTKQTTKDTANTSMYHSFIRNIFWELFLHSFKVILPAWMVCKRILKKKWTKE